MTMAENERFYEQGAKQYDIKITELLNWLVEKENEKVKDSGSIKSLRKRLYGDIEIIKGLIDNIVDWYEIKYPNQEIELTMEDDKQQAYFINNENALDDLKNMQIISKAMDVRQLAYRLPKSQLNLILCPYHAKNTFLRDIYNDKNEKVGEKPMISMKIYEEWTEAELIRPSFKLVADPISGQVDVTPSLKAYIDDDSITLDKLLNLLKEKYSNSNKLDFSELEKCINAHNDDIELRRKVLQLVALKILYSKNTTPEIGYERAQEFIDEFNEEINELHLSPKEIVEAINRDYGTTPPKAKGLVKSLLKEW